MFFTEIPPRPRNCLIIKQTPGPEHTKDTQHRGLTEKQQNVHFSSLENTHHVIMNGYCWHEYYRILYLLGCRLLQENISLCNNVECFRCPALYQSTSVLHFFPGIQRCHAMYQTKGYVVYEPIHIGQALGLIQSVRMVVTDKRQGTQSCIQPVAEIFHLLGPILLTWLNFIPSMYK